MENDILQQEQTWHKQFGMPILIAGPCSAESEEQVLETVEQLDTSRVNILRAGIWKPRTKPGSFEGIGEIGLKWLVKAREKTGLMISTEVANAYHVKKALEYDVDVLWLGARTTVNPFLVQEVAEALKDTDKIVIVKNPVNPDIGLWVGAMQRLASQGVQKLGVIHRGFSSYIKTKYRNKPEWQIAIEFRKQLPNIPMICDPSHIMGNREGIYDVSQKAFNLGYEGLMIETHRDPDNAWSDAKQQVTPAQLKEIIAKLELKTSTGGDSEYKEILASYREEIDDIDMSILEMVGHRMSISKKIGELKQQNNVPILQTDRWDSILNRITQEGKKLGLSEEYITRMFKAIHQESINTQNKVMVDNSSEK